MKISLFLLGIILLTAAARADAGAKTFRFGPVSATTKEGITPTTVYTEANGAGFEPDGKIESWPEGGCTSEGPFRFSVKLDPGVYRVDLVLGGSPQPAETTVKSEARRLMLENIKTKAGQELTCSAIVHVRVPDISATVKVKLKERELTTEMVAWDPRLTLEFSGIKPTVKALTITPTPQLPVLYILGDSTVCDQPHEPFASWGQMLPRWFGPTLAVANYAQSGESLRSSLGARRLEKVLSQLKTGDFVLIQFGHNDEKDKTPGAGAFTTYAELLRHYAQAIIEKHAQPILITPVQRRSFDAAGKLTNSHGEFPAAVKQVATELKLPLLDLHAQSTVLYEALGKEASGQLFKTGDGTHHNNFGAYELSRCIVTGIQRGTLPQLTQHLLPELPAYDPAHPDDPKTFALPASASVSTEKPLGN